MAGFIEFYISCNPPLLPEGVSLVMTDLQDSLGPSKVLEILYDPQVPWFKVIAYVEYQAEILRWMQSRLEQLLEEEAGAIDQDADQEDEFDIGGSKVQPDVEVLADKPHIVSWPVYSEGLGASVGKYDTFRFPQHIQELPHKTIWRGLECVEGATISDLTSKFDILWPTLDSKTSLRKLEEPGNLQVTYNCTETLAYIGTESDAQSLETAIRKLDTLLSFMVILDFFLSHTGFLTISGCPFTKESHLILAEAARPFRVSYQCLTHTGLSNLTYIDPTITFGADQERKLIEGAASLRVVTADARGRLSLDPTVYPLEHKLAKDPKLGFSSFAHYEYTNKRPNTSDSTEIRSIHQTRRQQQLLKKAAQTVKTPKETSRISKGLVNIENEGNEPKILSSATGKKKVQKETGLEGILFSELRGDSWQGSRSPLPTETSVANWIDGIELNYAKGSLELIPGLSEGNEVQHGITPDMTASVMTLAGGALLDLGSDDLQAGLEQTPKNSETQHLELLNFEEMVPSRQLVGVRTPKLRPGDDSIPNLLDSESPVKEFHGMFAHVDPFTLAVETGLNQGGNTCEKQKTLPPGESLMDYLDCHVHTPALMDSMDRDKQKSQSGKENKSATGHSSGVVFGKQGDATKEFFQTMRQKAASRPTWANIASKKKPTEGQNEEAPFGPNVRVSTVLAIPKPAGSEQKENRTRANAMGSQTFVENEPPSQNDGPSRGKSLGLATVSRDTSLPASATRAVPGMDLVTPDFMEGIEVVAKAEGKLQELVRILQVTPGLICLEAKFGRVCFKNQPPSLVNIGQGPAWSSESVLDRLNSNEHESQGAVGFYTILTTNGAEADLLSQLTAGKTSWMLREKQVYYEIVCRSHDGVTSLVVKVDADTFEYECLPTTQELSHLYVHCARRAWDVKFAISRMDLEAVPEDFKLFARSLVDSMSISSKNTGQIEIEADQDVRFGWQIERINIRHLAKYRNGPKGRSCLTITMTRIVKKFPNASNKHKTKFRGQTVPTTPPGKGSPTQWFEAHISSTRAEKLFEENLGLVFGERTRWTVEKLMEDGILSALCEPALRMVTKMDHVGESNSASQGFRTTGGQAYGTIDNTRDGKQEYQFW